MPAKRHVMHARDHQHGGADPVMFVWEDVGALSLRDHILSLDPDGFWPLDETSGLIANDISGNNHHLTSVRSALVWGQAAGPPGTLTPELHRDRLAWGGSGSGHAELVSAIDNFSAIGYVFVNNRAGPINFWMGFSTPVHGTGPGWQIGQDNSSFKIRVDWAAGSAGILGNNALADNTWYLIGISREAGTMKLYVDGLLQVETDTVPPTATTPGTGGGFWLGSDDYNYPGGTFALEGRVSYAAYWGSRALTGAEMLAIYEAGVTG